MFLFLLLFFSFATVIVGAFVFVTAFFAANVGCDAAISGVFVFWLLWLLLFLFSVGFGCLFIFLLLVVIANCFFAAVAGGEGVVVVVGVFVIVCGCCRCCFCSCSWCFWFVFCIRAFYTPYIGHSTKKIHNTRSVLVLLLLIVER